MSSSFVLFMITSLSLPCVCCMFGCCRVSVLLRCYGFVFRACTFASNSLSLISLTHAPSSTVNECHHIVLTACVLVFIMRSSSSSVMSSTPRPALSSSAIVVCCLSCSSSFCHCVVAACHRNSSSQEQNVNSHAKITF